MNCDDLRADIAELQEDLDQANRDWWQELITYGGTGLLFIGASKAALETGGFLTWVAVGAGGVHAAAADRWIEADQAYDAIKAQIDALCREWRRLGC